MNPSNVNWISHRGYKEQAPENSRAAFDAAIGLGFKTLETDLRLSADGHIVLHHDPNLIRLAGDARPIVAMTRSELESVKVDGHDLFFLEEFVTRYADRSWVFDIKPESGIQVITRLVEMTQTLPALAHFPARTRFVIWDVRQAKLLKSIWPDAELFASEAECWRAGLAVIVGLPSLGGIRSGLTYSLPPRLGPIKLYTKQKIEAFHRHGAKVLAFLPERDIEVAAALEAGVDEVLTNGRIA